MKIQFYTITFFITTNVLAQAVKIKDAYGNKVVYINGNTLRVIDAYVSKVYYFEGIPEKWVIVCLIR